MLARTRAAILARADAIAEDPDKASAKDCALLIVAVVLVLLSRNEKGLDRGGAFCRGRARGDLGLLGRGQRRAAVARHAALSVHG
jgi:hypothetical protein